MFSYKLESDYAKEKGIYGRHLIFIKIDIHENSVGGKEAAFWIKITNDDKIPKTVEEINNLEFIELVNHRFEAKNMIFKDKDINVKPNKRGMIPIYRTAIHTTSKRSIPKKLIYVGNFPGIIPPADETLGYEDAYMIGPWWHNFEEAIIDDYFIYNKGEFKPRKYM